jgi:hypothetical protein
MRYDAGEIKRLQTAMGAARSHFLDEAQKSSTTTFDRAAERWPARASGFPMAPTGPPSVAGASVGCALQTDEPVARRSPATHS